MEHKKQIKGEGLITPPMMIAMINPGTIIICALAPAILGIMLAGEKQNGVSLFLSIIITAIPVLFNASVNLLNDYFDYVRGNDTKDNVADANDAPLAYYEIEDPKPVLRLGVLFLVIGMLLGLFIIYRSGIAPLIVGSIGVLAVLAYSAGRIPLSHYPVGELVAGFVMGGLIPLGVYSSFTGMIDPMILYKSIPLMLVVSQLMLLNNTCDIEKDTLAGRKTLPILIGRAKALMLCKILTIFWILQMVQVIVTWYRLGTIVILAMLVLCRKSFVAILRGKRTAETKNEDIAALAGAALGVVAAYPVSILVHLLFG